MKRSVKVFNILFDDRFGGPSKRVALVSEPLKQQGFSTTLVFPMGDGNAERIARDFGVDVVRIAFSRIPRPRNPGQVLRWLLKLPLDIHRFRRLYAFQKPDIVHVNGAFFLAPAIAAKFGKIPLVWHLNDVIVPAIMAPLLGRLVRLLADTIVVSSQAVGVHYKVPPDLVTVLYPPVDTEKIRPRQHADGWGETSGPVTLGLIANWNPIKGVDHFIRAAALVYETVGNRLRIVLAGARLSNHSEYREKVDSLIDDFGLRPVVQNLGFRPDIDEVLRQIDIVVMSSMSEAVSMVVMEGMAAGLPVVATDVGGVRELLKPASDRPAGLIVPPARPRAMAEAILTLVRDSETARRMGVAGRRYVEAGFSIEKAADRHHEIYCRAMNRKVLPAERRRGSEI